MTPDERWDYYLTVPALVVHPFIYAVSTGYYLCCRAGFAKFLDFAEDFEGLPERTRIEDAA